MYSVEIGGGNPEIGSGAAGAQDAFGDLILPVILVVVVGACALCCVIIVIVRQICYNRKRNKVSFDAADEPEKKRKSRGHYDHAHTQSIEMGGVNPFDEPDGNRKSTGDRKGYGLHRGKRSRNDIIDGQILTVPMRDGRAGPQTRNRGPTTQFSSNIANIASGNNVLMDDVVEQIGNGTSFGMPRKNYAMADGGLAPTSKSTKREESIHSNSGHSEDDDPDIDPSPTDSEQKQNGVGVHMLSPFGRADDESDDIRNERPELHNYSTNLMALAPTSIISESEQKLNRPPAHETRSKQKSNTNSLGPRGRAGPLGGYHDITGSQFGKLQRAINNAKTASDFEKLEEIIKSGQIPESDWHGKGKGYNSHGGGSSFKGMVARAFDPNTAITSQAMSESEDQSDHAFIYKMNSVISNNSISNYGHHSRLNKLPNMGNTDSVATVDSIGVKMPQYRRHKTGQYNINKNPK